MSQWRALGTVDGESRETHLFNTCHEEGTAMFRAAIVVFVLTTAGLCVVQSAAAQERQRGRRQRAEPADSTLAVFSLTERQIFIDYFAEHEFEVEPLPPGIARNVGRGKPLPPGIAKRRLPADLVAQLPTRTGVEITIFGDRIVLLEASGLVVDILEGIFR
jgi:hypothetical protein